MPSPPNHQRDLAHDSPLDPGLEPQRILLIRPSALGDVCRTVPLLVSLRNRWPNARIDWLVQTGFEDAVALHPAFAPRQSPVESEARADGVGERAGVSGGGGVIPFPRARFGNWASPPTTLATIRWMNHLRAVNYDLVLDAQGLARSGLFARWTGAPHRFGYADAAELAWLGVNHRVDAPASLHTVDRMLALVQAAGAEPRSELRLYSDPAERISLQERPWAQVSDRYIVIAPTSRWPGKVWPAGRYAHVVRSLLDSARPAISAAIIVGSSSERPQCGPLLELAMHEPRVIDLVGNTSIRSLMALIERCSLLIGSDSAALHMAVGFDRPIVALYGPTRVDLVGPYKRERDVIQHIDPADKLDHKDPESGQRLMSRITASEVVHAAMQRLHT